MCVFMCSLSLSALLAPCAVQLHGCLFGTVFGTVHVARLLLACLLLLRARLCCPQRHRVVYGMVFQIKTGGLVVEDGGTSLSRSSASEQTLTVHNAEGTSSFSGSVLKATSTRASDSGYACVLSRWPA